MSGGHFDYNQNHIEDIAEQLEKDIDDIEYARRIGKVKKKQLYGHLLNVIDGRKSWPNWLMELIRRYDNLDDLYKSLRESKEIHEKDGKFFVDNCNGPGLCEIVVYEGVSEEWSDSNWHFEIEDPDVLEEFKRGLRILKMAAIYAQRIDWLMSGDDGEESFKRRLKEELDELDSKPLIDYERWKRCRDEK